MNTNYPYTVAIATSKENKAGLIKYAQIFKPQPQIIFNSVKDALAFAQEFLKIHSSKRVIENQPHKLIPIVNFDNEVKEFPIYRISESLNQSEYDSDTYRFLAYSQVLVDIKPIANNYQSYWKNCKDYVYILPVGYKPAFIEKLGYECRVKIISNLTVKNLLIAAEKSKQDSHKWIIKNRKNKGGSEQAGV